MRCLGNLAMVLSSFSVAPVGGLRAEVTDGALATPVPSFSFNIKDVLCADPANEIFKGFFSANPTILERIKKEGLDLANFHNCRLCDVAGQQGGWAAARVTCAAYNEVATAGAGPCLAGNGRTGWRQGAHACLPCPDECASCAPPGLMDASYLGSRWFRCVLPVEAAAPLPAAWRCEAPRDRRSHPGQFRFCKYRSDLLSTAVDGEQPSSRTSWDVRFAAAPCNDTGLPASENPDLEAEGGAAPAVRSIMEAVGPKFALAFKQNCAICSASAGGRLTHGAPSASTEFWADGSCAHATMGVHACRHDRGLVGWSPQLCQPCPAECLSCQDDSTFFKASKGFKCKIAPSTPVRGLLSQVFEAGSPAAGEGGAPRLPPGYECSEPVKRSCTSGSGLCSGYKVSCKYRKFEN